MTLSPIIIQSTIMKVHHDTFAVSTIGRKTWTNYLLAQGLERIENVPRARAISIAQLWSTPERLHYMQTHWPVYLKLFRKNIRSNLKADPKLLQFDRKDQKGGLAQYMSKFNRRTLDAHNLLAILIIALLLVRARKRDWNTVILLVGLSLLNYYILLTSGLSFFQGDRLVLPAIAIWTVLYLWVLYALFQEDAFHKVVWHAVKRKPKS